MATSVYSINKGINKPITFKGLKAQYIWLLAGGLGGLLVLYVIMHLFDLNTYLSLAIIVVIGAGLIAYIYRLSGKFGQYGLMKKLAQKRIPSGVICNSRKPFQNLKK